MFVLVEGVAAQDRQDQGKVAVQRGSSTLHNTIAPTSWRQPNRALNAPHPKYRNGRFRLVDADGRFLEVNQAFCQLTGYSREELLRMAIRDVEADETPTEIAANIERIQGLGSARFERRQRCKDGQLVDVEASVNQLPGSGGRLVCFLRDITDRKRAEEACDE